MNTQQAHTMNTELSPQQLQELQSNHALQGLQPFAGAHAHTPYLGNLQQKYTRKIVDTVQDWGPPPLDVIIHKESLDSMLGSLQQVSGRRLEAVRHYYGIGEEAKTLQETGDAMGVSRQRAHALVTEAVAFIRDTEYQPETL